MLTHKQYHPQITFSSWLSRKSPSLSDRTRTLWTCHHFQAVDVPAWHWLRPRAKGQPAITQGDPTSLGGVLSDYFPSGNW